MLKTLSFLKSLGRTAVRGPAFGVALGNGE